MIIRNLAFLDQVNLEETIIGGAASFAFTKTIADEGYANGQASGVAIGDLSYTQTKTMTNIVIKPRITISKAKAEADAIAIDKNGYSQSSSRSLSIYVNIYS